jgi:hypothetical protein
MVDRLGDDCPATIESGSGERKVRQYGMKVAFLVADGFLGTLFIGFFNLYCEFLRDLRAALLRKKRAGRFPTLINFDEALSRTSTYSCAPRLCHGVLPADAIFAVSPEVAPVCQTSWYVSGVSAFLRTSSARSRNEYAKVYLALFV